MIEPSEDEELDSASAALLAVLVQALKKELGRERERADAAFALVADLRKATRDGVFILTLDEARRERGERLLDRADAMLDTTRSGEPAGAKESA